MKPIFEDILRVNLYIVLNVHSLPFEDVNGLKNAKYDQTLQTLESFRIIACLDQPLKGSHCSFRYVIPRTTQVDLSDRKRWKSSTKNMR